MQIWVKKPKISHILVFFSSKHLKEAIKWRVLHLYYINWWNDEKKPFWVSKISVKQEKLNIYQKGG